MKKYRLIKMMADERGTIMITTLYFLFLLCGMFALFLFAAQVDVLEMKAQHTADLISKGARAAGQWRYIDESGKVQKRLFATTEEAREQQAKIIRGAREEAEILYQLNSREGLASVDQVTVVHQKGEKKYLYNQGIYHVAIELTQRISLFFESFAVTLRRVAQSEI